MDGSLSIIKFCTESAPNNIYGFESIKKLHNNKKTSNFRPYNKNLFNSIFQDFFRITTLSFFTLFSSNLKNEQGNKFSTTFCIPGFVIENNKLAPTILGSFLYKGHNIPFWPKFLMILASVSHWVHTKKKTCNLCLSLNTKSASNKHKSCV